MTSVPTARHGGSKAVRAGTSKGTKGDSIISQTIQVPSGRTKLAVAWQGRCDDRLSKAWATILVEDTASHQKRTMLPRTCTRKGGLAEGEVGGHRRSRLHRAVDQPRRRENVDAEP